MPEPLCSSKKGQIYIKCCLYNLKKHIHWYTDISVISISADQYIAQALINSDYYDDYSSINTWRLLSSWLANSAVLWLYLCSYELSGGYKPAPLDLSHIKLTSTQEAMVDKLAENAHNVWARDRIRQGWTYGIQQVAKLTAAKLSLNSFK